MLHFFVCLIDRRDLNLPKGKRISKRCYYNFTGVIVILLNVLKNFLISEVSIGHLEIQASAFKYKHGVSSIYFFQTCHFQ